VSHGTITVNSVRVVTVISVAVCGGYSSPGSPGVSPGRVRGQTGGRVCSLLLVTALNSAPVIFYPTDTFA
jgi:hypothetical protein